jgi:hypothetical protein
MKPDSDGSDSLRDLLLDDVAHLPAMASHAAREHRARQARNRRVLARAAVFVMLGVCGFQSLQWIRQKPNDATLTRNLVTQPTGPRLPNLVMVQTLEEALVNPLPPPPGITPEQKVLLESTNGLPILLVMDAPGTPPRMVVVER